LKLLLDTQLLLWAAGQPERLSPAARKQIADPKNDILFSAASIWEVSIKNSLGRKDFRIEPRLLRRGLLDNGYSEMVITTHHAANVDGLPPLHKDPFDRMLVSQALTEGVILLTSDAMLTKYGAAVRKV
jgi:PIN domain nuclease of toxin-antitoxin system